MPSYLIQTEPEWFPTFYCYCKSISFDKPESCKSEIKYKLKPSYAMVIHKNWCEMTDPKLNPCPERYLNHTISFIHEIVKLFVKEINRKGWKTQHIAERESNPPQLQIFWLLNNFLSFKVLVNPLFARHWNFGQNLIKP